MTGQPGPPSDLDTTEREGRQRRVLPMGVAAVAAVAVIALIVVLLVVVLESGDGSDDVLDETSLGLILEDPGSYEGEEVVTSGTVREVLSDEAFTLDSQQTLVVLDGADPPDQSIVENTPVFVRATVQSFDRESVEDDTGLAIDGEPSAVLVASAVSTQLDEVNQGDVGEAETGGDFLE